MNDTALEPRLREVEISASVSAIDIKRLKNEDIKNLKHDVSDVSDRVKTIEDDNNINSGKNVVIRTVSVLIVTTLMSFFAWVSLSIMDNTVEISYIRSHIDNQILEIEHGRR